MPEDLRHDNGFSEDFASDDIEHDYPDTTAADVESAGRSCLVILALLVAIVLFLLVWVVFRSTAGS